jgi:hypothetical protein
MAMAARVLFTAFALVRMVVWHAGVKCLASPFAPRESHLLHSSANAMPHSEDDDVVICCCHHMQHTGLVIAVTAACGTAVVTVVMWVLYTLRRAGLYTSCGGIGQEPFIVDVAATTVQPSSQHSSDTRSLSQAEVAAVAEAAGGALAAGDADGIAASGHVASAALDYPSMLAYLNAPRGEPRTAACTVNHSLAACCEHILLIALHAPATMTADACILLMLLQALSPFGRLLRAPQTPQICMCPQPLVTLPCWHAAPMTHCMCQTQ